ncbi:palmitoyltransferase swf1 [Kalmusia sp. IMI 367209]|nr:palmitoyltransferase swf1 [Kalmusia sp. IMI 367209]
MSRALSKKEQQQQIQRQHQQQGQYARDVETQEHHSSANASAGLNLNLFGALSGALSSTKRKETHKNPDGSSHSIEDSHDKGILHSFHRTAFPCFPIPSSSAFFVLSRRRELLIRVSAGAASALASGEGNAYAQGAAVNGAKHQKSREIGQAQQQGKIQAGQKQAVDHLGIEN